MTGTWQSNILEFLLKLLSGTSLYLISGIAVTFP
jgi:hypothetical protein